MARVAIEFDNQQIFLAVAQSASGRTKLKHLAYLQHENSEEAAISDLTEEVSRLGIGKSDTVAVVRRTDVELRLLDVPPAPKNELPAMVKFAAKNEFASLNDSWLLDFVRLSGDATTPGKVLAAGLAPENKARIQKAVEAAGLRLKKIAFRPLAVAKHLSVQLADQNLRLLIEQDPNRANISLFDGYSMLAARTIRFRSNAIAETLEQEVKRTVAVANKSADQLNEILLLGSIETIAPIGESLSKSLGIQHRVIDVGRDPAFGKKLKSIDRNYRYVPLLGALSEEQLGVTPSMDFLNPRKVEIQKSDYSKWYLSAAAIALGLLLLLGFGYWQLSNQGAQIKQRQDRLQEITLLNNGETERPAVAQTVKQVEKIDAWVANGINWQDTLMAYSDHALTPDDAIVDSLIANQKGSAQLTIRARIANTQTEGDLVKELQKHPEFITTQKGSKQLDDREFSTSSRIEIAIERDFQQQLREIDKRAKAFVSELRAARAAAAKSKNPSN